MNAMSDRSLRQISWSTLVLFALGFWLSGSLILDSVIIPGLFAAGMMTQEAFASAGYVIFGIFNRIELVCAAIVLTSFLVFRSQHNLTAKQEKWSVVLASLLFAIAIIYTYILTPQLSGWGMQLNLLDTTAKMPSQMFSLHWGYWILEAIKLICGATLLRWCYRNSCSLN